MSREDKNQNGKSNTEMKLIGKKDRKLSKKKSNRGNLAEGKISKLELRQDIRTTTHGTSP
jgi:hypothetical protein